MMGDRLVRQNHLFYDVCLEDRVPPDHLVRRLDSVLDLGWLRKELAPYYSHTGCPSVDPELMIRMLLIGYCYSIRSERRDVLPGHERMARGLLLSAVGKFPGMVVRLALVFEYLAWAIERGRPEPEAISAGAVGAAIALIEAYSLPMARRALAAGSQSPKAKNAALVTQWVLDNRPERVNLRDLRRLAGFPVTDPQALDEAALLVAEASIWRLLPSSNSRGTKRKDYEISPLVRSADFADFAKFHEDDGAGEKVGKVDKLGNEDLDPERAAIMAVDGGAE